jgi:hypothetical protein
MNGNVKCVEKQGINNECMHVKCKYVVTILWNKGIKFHLLHLVTILWGFFIFYFHNNERVFYNLCYYIVDENV